MITTDETTRAGRTGRGNHPAIVWRVCALTLLLTRVAGADPPVAESHEPPPVQLVRIPLPVTGPVDRRVQASIEQLLERWSKLPSGQRRPILVLEFRAGGGRDGGGGASQFEQALSLARYLSGARLARIRTVAWLTGPVAGHAVLPVLACEQIIVAPEAELGRAGADEPHVDQTLRSAYRDLADRRRTLPVPLVMGMLDEQPAVYRVQTLDGTRFVLEDDLPELRQEVAVSSVEQLVPRGELANFTGNELRLELGFATHLARDRAELAAALRVPPGRIQEDPTLGDETRPLLVELVGPIQRDNIAWIERGLREQIDGQRVNLVFLMIDSPGGSLTNSLRLASYLAELDTGRVRTVAYVPSEARSDAALIALAADLLMVGEHAVLGGPGHQRIGPQALEDARPAVQQIARQKARPWSLLMAMLDQELTIRRYQQEGTGAVRFLAADELAEQTDVEDWRAADQLPTASGLRGPLVVETGLAAKQAANLAEVQAAFQVTEGLPAVRPNWAHRLIEFLASPRVAGTLLFVGWFALMFEFMSPGLGLPGFLSAVCFLLFFWSSVLHGTAGWLEILLFVAGIVFVALEILVLPGVGAFGIGGAAMIVASIILASQTFVIPRNPYEWSQVPNSLLVLSAAGAGMILSLLCMPRLLTQAPWFRRIALESPDAIEREAIRYQESLVHWDYLVGKRGVTVTPLTPSGKAQFGDELVDVISDGDLVPAGADIRVAEVRGNEVVVRTLT